MAMGACPGQIPMPCVPPALMVTATMVRACRYILYTYADISSNMVFVRAKGFPQGSLFELNIFMSGFCLNYVICL